MTTLTQCQQQVLDMLISYQKERGFPPTNQEVATMLGYRSVNAAVEHLRALEKKGVITIKRGVARGITLHTAVKDDDSEAVGIIRSLRDPPGHTTLYRDDAFFLQCAKMLHRCIH